MENNGFRWERHDEFTRDHHIEEKKNGVVWVIIASIQCDILLETSLYAGKDSLQNAKIPMKKWWLERHEVFVNLSLTFTSFQQVRCRLKRLSSPNRILGSQNMLMFTTALHVASQKTLRYCLSLFNADDTTVLSS